MIITCSNSGSCTQIDFQRPLIFCVSNRIRKVALLFSECSAKKARQVVCAARISYKKLDFHPLASSLNQSISGKGNKADKLMVQFPFFSKQVVLQSCSAYRKLRNGKVDEKILCEVETSMQVFGSLGKALVRHLIRSGRRRSGSFQLTFQFRLPPMTGTFFSVEQFCSTGSTDDGCLSQFLVGESVSWERLPPLRITDRIGLSLTFFLPIRRGLGAQVTSV